MRYYVLEYMFLNFITSLILCDGIGISSKLDLDSLRSSPKLIDNNRYKQRVFHTNPPTQNKKTDDFDSIGVICTSGEGCNTTKTTNSNSKDSIETDVVVHVKTSVGLNNNSKNVISDETPDIPVIVGTSDSNQNNQFLNRPSVLIGDDTLFSVNPSTVSPPPITSLNYPHQSFIPSTAVFTQTPNYASRPAVNIESLISEKEARTDRDNVIEVHIPRFESSYHNHYFGENPPPQVVWFPKTSEYRPKVSRPSFWSVPEQSTPHKHPEGVTCTCKNEVSRGLQWYPARRVYGTNPTRKIDDKLAPLD